VLTDKAVTGDRRGFYHARAIALMEATTHSQLKHHLKMMLVDLEGTELD
jgi:hypothetical protein